MRGKLMKKIILKLIFGQLRIKKENHLKFPSPPLDAVRYYSTLTNAKKLDLIQCKP
jgi:hypothetical protein